MVDVAVLPEAGEPVGVYLRRQRLAAGRTQAQVAARAGIARPNVAAIKSGCRHASPDMAVRLLDAIRGPAPRRRLELSPPVLLNLEVARVAAGHVIREPADARSAMVDHLAALRTSDDGSCARWLDDWDAILARWDLAEVVSLLLSTDPDDVERRKVSPISALVSPPEREDAARRAREIWRATRRVP